jgi:hypothetical protein
MPTAHKLPPVEVLHELFEEKEPGVLYWKVDVYNGPSQNILVKAKGALAGYKKTNEAKRSDARWYMRWRGQYLMRSRIIWKMHHGKDPLGYIDHINGDSLDDRIENLRDVVSGENSRNRGPRDGSSYVIYQEHINNSSCKSNALKFTISLWPGEDIEAIQQELHDAIAPIVDRIYDNRRGRQRPPSPRLPAPIKRAVNGNANPAFRRDASYGREGSE